MLRYRTWLGREWLMARVGQPATTGDRTDADYTGRLFESKLVSGLPIRHYVMSRVHFAGVPERNYDGHLGINGQFIDSVY